MAKANSPTPITGKDLLFEIEKNYLFVVLLSLTGPKVYHFKNDKGMVSLRKKNFFFLKKVILIANGNWPDKKMPKAKKE